MDLDLYRQLIFNRSTNKEWKFFQQVVIHMEKNEPQPLPHTIYKN